MHGSGCGSSNNNNLRHSSSFRRPPSSSNISKKRDCTPNTNAYLHPTKMSSKIARSKSVPHWPNRFESYPHMSKQQHIQQQQQQLQPHILQGVDSNPKQVNNRPATMTCNDVESNLTNSIDNLEWNELLRILQEEYTKLVL